MIHLSRHSSSSSHGQATVEFAFAAIGFFLILFGIIEGGRLLFTYHEVTNAAREGARYAAAQGYHSGDVLDSGPVATYVSERVAGLDPGALALEAKWPGDANCGTNPEKPERNRPGCPVTVDVTYPYQPMVGMIFGSGTITLEAESSMRVHY